MDISGDKLSAAIIRAIQDQAREAAKYNGEATASLISETHRGHLQVVDAIHATSLPPNLSRSRHANAFSAVSVSGEPGG